jgi:hypothetical protein
MTHAASPSAESGGAVVGLCLRGCGWDVALACNTVVPCLSIRGSPWVVGAPDARGGLRASTQPLRCLRPPS